MQASHREDAGMPTADRGTGHDALSAEQRPSAGLTLLLVACLLAVAGAVAAGWMYYQGERAATVRQKSSELSAIRDLKIDQIVRWKAGLLADGRQAARDPAVSDELAPWLTDPGDARVAGALREWLDSLIQERGYPSALIMTLDGSHWVSSTGGPSPDASDTTELRAVRPTPETTMTDLFLDPATGRPRLDVVAPLRGSGTAARTVLILHCDPNKLLYPLIQGWPTPSPSGETLLVRRTNHEVVFLNELRFRQGTALKLSVPLTRTDMPTVMALSGPRRVVEGNDYRGQQVLAAVGPVAGTSWYIVAKVDAAEAYQGLSDREGLILVVVVLVVLVTGLGFGLAWRQRTAAYYRKDLESERAARLLSQQYDLITKYAYDVVMLADEDLRILQANDAATEVYGYTRDELLGMTLADLHDPSTRDRAREEAELAKREGSRVFEAKHARKGGTLIDMEVSVRAIESEGRTFLLSIKRDITARKRAEEELLARAEDLARSNAELEKFAYIASHDLQEPLRMVSSYTQLLQRRYQGRLDSDADEFIAYAVDGANRMQTLIKDLLAYSRVGTQGAPFSPTDLETVFGDVLGALEQTIADAGATVTHDHLPVVSCDPTQIGRVFQNLVANAVKFHRDEPPKVHVSAREADGEWVLSVADNGIGVDPEYFDRIFVIFQRLRSRADYPGTGMGLAICKRIIDRHGGRIWVESAPGVGSTFYFTLRGDKEA
jgi:PAS domain S-box-containing protein